MADTRQLAPWVGDAPNTWAEVDWPSWVPANVRAQIESFWSASNGRRPRDYQASAASPYNHAPDFGEVVTLVEDNRVVTGRWVHAWNNMGRVIDDAGAVYYISSNSYRRDPAERAAYLAEVIAHARTRVERARQKLAEQELALSRLAAAASPSTGGLPHA